MHKVIVVSSCRCDAQRLVIMDYEALRELVLPCISVLNTARKACKALHDGPDWLPLFQHRRSSEFCGKYVRQIAPYPWRLHLKKMQLRLPFLNEACCSFGVYELDDPQYEFCWRYGMILDPESTVQVTADCVHLVVPPFRESGEVTREYNLTAYFEDVL